MSLGCASEFFVRDINGQNLTRFTWFCRGHWMAIQNVPMPPDHPLHVQSGRMGDWKWVLSYLALAARQAAEGYEYSVAGHSGFFNLSRNLTRVSDLAALLGMPADHVRAELADYVIQTDAEPDVSKEALWLCVATGTPGTWAGADEGRNYLSQIIEALEADPPKYRAMNPENGWGDYDSLLSTLREMRDASVAHPNPTWKTSG